MNGLRQWIGRLQLQLRRNNHVVGWQMTPEEAIHFFKSQRKTVLTFFGYSVDYYDPNEMLSIVRETLWKYSPRMTLVNIGATKGGIGAAYPLIRSMGFDTAGIVSSQAIEHSESISEAVHHICFIRDQQWGGKLPHSQELSPTSKAMVACSDILVAIGGNDIARDELLEGRRQGKPIQYFPAEMDHEAAVWRARQMGNARPDSFMGSVHDVFGK